MVVVVVVVVAGLRAANPPLISNISIALIAGFPVFRKSANDTFFWSFNLMQLVSSATSMGQLPTRYSLITNGSPVVAASNFFSTITSLITMLNTRASTSASATKCNRSRYNFPCCPGSLYVSGACFATKYRSDL